MAAIMACGIVLVLAFIVSFSEDSRAIVGPAKAATLLEAAVSRDETGRLVLEPSADLTAFIEAQPALWYVVSDGRTTLTHGTIPVASGGNGLRQGRLSYPEFDVGATVIHTDAGPISIEVGGVARLSVPEMILFAMGASGATNVYVIFGFVLIAMALAHLVVMPRLIARPVWRVARAAEGIDGLPAGRRLPDAAAPKELVPLIEAFNRALQRIDDASSAQRSFLSNAAHELRTPLARLRTKVEDVPEDGLRNALVSDVQTLSSIVSTLLHLARLSGQPHAQQPVDLVNLCRVAVAELAPSALTEGIEIEVVAPNRPVVVQGADTAIRSAVANLVRNAIRHSGSGGRIVVAINSPGEIRVIDHGPGLPTADRNRLFQPFTRGPTADEEGVGLGLAIVWQVMAMHGGLVTATDTPGGGATIILAFPGAGAGR